MWNADSETVEGVFVGPNTHYRHWTETPQQLSNDGRNARATGIRPRTRLVLRLFVRWMASFRPIGNCESHRNNVIFHHGAKEFQRLIRPRIPAYPPCGIVRDPGVRFLTFGRETRYNLVEAPTV